jgi:type I restriction enzyme S subunit
VTDQYPVQTLAEISEVFADGDWVESKDQAVAGIRLIQTGNVGLGVFKARDGKARYVSGDTFNRLRCTEIFEGDCLISRLPDPVGRACLVPHTGVRMITAVDCTIVRFKRDVVIPAFFGLYSQSADYLKAVDSQTTGATRSRISRSSLGQIPVPVPTIPEQQRIVRVLDEAFASIATARANTEQNLRNARELLGAATESLFPAVTQGQAGARTLAELCDLIGDCEHKTAPTQDEGIPSIRTPNIGRGRLILDGVNRVSDDTYRAWTRRVEPKAGDLILAREAPAGNVAVIPDGLKVCLGQRTVLLRPDRSVFEPAYLAHLLLQRDSQRRLLAGQRGATVQHVNVQDIRAFGVSGVPSLEVQQTVVQKIDALLENGDALEAGFQRKLAALDALKQSLLHQAFTGAL